MNFNFKVRAKNPLFWIANVVAVLVYIGGYLGIKGTDVTSWDKLFSIIGDIVANPYLIVMIVVTFVTTAISYTDKGIKDTGIVQTYTKPRNDKNPSEFVQWQKDVDKEHSSLLEENKQLKKDKEEEQREIKEAMNNDSDEEGELLAPERKTKKVEEFDTSQPFTDDSDEVEFDVADYEDEREVALGESRFHDDSELKDGKEDESKKEDFIENIDDVIINDSVDNNKEDIDKTVKKTITKEVIEDEKESDK